MAQTTNTSKSLTILELSIQISLNGLSFCILKRDTNTITVLRHHTFEKKRNPFEVLDYLKHLFNTESTLQQSFNKVCVVYINELSSLVPKPLFDEDCLADYLKFNSKILKSDFITYDDIALNESVNVYVPYVNINNFIYEKFGAFVYKHYSTILIEQILHIEKNIDDEKMYANVNPNHFEILVLKHGKLILYNTFEYATKEDFIYYLLFTAEQLNLNPETFRLVLIGDIVKGDPLYAIAYKYIRNVEFGNRHDSYSFLEKPETNHSDFTLIKSL